jgi:hypothetical protein
MTAAITLANDGAMIESVVVHGDLSHMSPEQKTIYYVKLCESVGLNPLTRPFAYLRLNGKEVLYALRDAADQLRKIHGVSIRITAREHVGDVYVVTASATDKTGRVDESTGAVPVGSMKGESLANALMKAETKAKRRVTLSICGLGMLDETELDTIPAESIKPVFTSEQSATAEEQAKRRLEGEAMADEWLPMIDALTDERSFWAFCDFNGWQLATLHNNAKAKVWRVLEAKSKVFGLKQKDVKEALRSSQEPMSRDDDVDADDRAALENIDRGG